ncbi:hypothetical protein NQ317_008732 [Molorchus minor]|uniref:Uncharacterized protein n=1 Tax=Molorchus minor TaxID=1323400 RepID=A0ABQ9IS80_9CUCU|nr:hypothetical protein NQ317_008732 [Molorchus minor]
MRFLCLLVTAVFGVGCHAISQPVYPNQYVSAQVVPATAYKQPSPQRYLPRSQPTIQPVYETRDRDGLQNYATQPLVHQPIQQLYGGQRQVRLHANGLNIPQWDHPRNFLKEAYNMAVESHQNALAVDYIPTNTGVQSLNSNNTTDFVKLFKGSSHKPRAPITSNRLCSPLYYQLKQEKRLQPPERKAKRQQGDTGSFTNTANSVPEGSTTTSPDSAICQGAAVAICAQASYSAVQGSTAAAAATTGANSKKRKRKMIVIPTTDQFQTNPNYQFGFDVNDDQFTNYQNRKEQRDGNKITGSYSVVDSDGYIRTVPIHRRSEGGIQSGGEPF